jgi:hypothetical protein
VFCQAAVFWWMDVLESKATTDILGRLLWLADSGETDHPVWLQYQSCILMSRPVLDSSKGLNLGHQIPGWEEVARLLRGGDVDDLRTFRRQGLSITEIHRLTGFDRKAIRRYLLDSRRPRYGLRTPRPSKLEPYLAERLQVGDWNARALLRELRERGYGGGYPILADYLRC